MNLKQETKSKQFSMLERQLHTYPNQAIIGYRQDV